MYLDLGFRPPLVILSSHRFTRQGEVCLASLPCYVTFEAMPRVYVASSREQGDTCFLHMPACSRHVIIFSAFTPCWDTCRCGFLARKQKLLQHALKSCNESLLNKVLTDDEKDGGPIRNCDCGKSEKDGGGLRWKSRFLHELKEFGGFDEWEMFSAEVKGGVVAKVGDGAAHFIHELKKEVKGLVQIALRLPSSNQSFW